MATAPHPQFPHLFSPIAIRGVELRNRVMISAHYAGWWVDRGLPSREFAAYIEERCKNGVGLFVIGATSPQHGSGWMENLSDEIIPRYQMLADAGHRHGAKIFAQLCHPGFHPLPGPTIYADPIKAVPTQPEYREPPRHEPPLEEIQQLIYAHAAAAARAAKGGMDGVELHSHESFLHAQFLNPLWNTRTDEYGGSLENRMRFLIETLTAMREAIGAKLPLGVRLKIDDVAQRGMTVDDFILVARRLEEMQLVDYVIFTGGDGRHHHGPMPRPDGEWLPLVKKMRAATKLVLAHAGRITTPQMAEQALADGVLDLVCMTKAHIADPHHARKAFEGRLDDIRYCTRCLQACHGTMHRMTCVYNPLTSRESKWSTLPPANKKKRVVIVGGGPAGMECAVTAAQRGHEVIVLERDARVGGQIWVGAGSPLRQLWARIAEFYERQSRKGYFETRLNTEATAEKILSLNPDAVVVATGSRPIRLDIAGGAPALTVHEVIAGKADEAKHVLIFDREGFNRPLVAADYLSTRGVQVDFASSLLEICPVTEGMMRTEMFEHLLKRGVRFWPGEELVGWDDGGIRLRSVQTADERVIEDVDTVMATVGSTPVCDLGNSLRGRVSELHVIGDANLPQTCEQATYQGARIGRLL